MKNKGITIVALIVTIILMLILAGVMAVGVFPSLTTMISKSEREKEIARAEAVKEAKEEWIVDLQYAKELGYTGKSIVKLTEELIAQNLITDEEAEEIKLTWQVTIADRTIIFDDTKNINSIITEGERTAYVPKGYVASNIPGEDTISGGLVIYEGTEPVIGEVNSTEHVNAMETRNQYVWIPVDDINRMVMCKRNGVATKVDGTATTDGKTVCELELQGNELVCTTHGYTTATGLTVDNIDTIGLAGRLYGTDSTLKETTSDGKKIYQTAMNFDTNNQTFTKDTGYREPDLVTSYDQDDATSTKNYMEAAGIGDKTATTLKKQLNSDFIAMAKSVAKYGGFYIGRYEAGTNGTTKKNQLVLTAAISASGNYVAGNMWYGLYNTLRNKTGVNTNVVKSHMIWRKSV